MKEYMSIVGKRMLAGILIILACGTLFLPFSAATIIAIILFLTGEFLRFKLKCFPVWLNIVFFIIEVILFGSLVMFRMTIENAYHANGGIIN